ncbi:DEAD/DEAH box helicase [Bacillus sp. NTK071]|uniref:DEAD/DEAH box helicase n=1 Tax=Bacillus sp. NTK071 TaxID=2802175 RepID=UPI001A8FE9A0|nr:DEAD/DEAH box helicase [Bacillus sp. NTK071]MBN8209422.1 DEAD/DEAH box helicase [Bacillus sp. NTK071]
MKMFDNHPFLSENWQAAGFTNLSQVQEKAIPRIMDGEDLLVEAPTGTGKTLAYLLPIMQKMDPEKKNTQAIVLAPTRELAMQVFEVSQGFLKGSGMTAASLIGGAAIKRQLEKLKKHPQLIVGTPNRIAELIDMKKLKMNEVRTIVADEADQVLHPSTIEDVSYICQSALRDCQLLFFSATISDKVLIQAKKLSDNPSVLSIAATDEEKKAIDHSYYVTNRREKPELLRKLARKEGVKALAFVNNSNYLSRLKDILATKKISFDVLDSSTNKTERKNVLNRFRNDQIQLLLTTDLAARGLDIDNITHVFHYDLSEDARTYLHRSGRTGRMGKEGSVVTLLLPGEEKYLEKITQKLELELKRKNAPKPANNPTNKRGKNK